MMVLSRGMTAHRIDVNTIKQPVQLFGRQLDHCLLAARPHEVVLLETF
jgi:hypothetical protein